MSDDFYKKANFQPLTETTVTVNCGDYNAIISDETGISKPSSGVWTVVSTSDSKCDKDSQYTGYTVTFTQ